MRASGPLLAVALLLLLAVTWTSAAQSCIDDNGEPVDWFVIVKVPRLKTSKDPGVLAGTAYLYGDARSYARPLSFWSTSRHQISDATSAPGRTLTQLYKGASNKAVNGYLMWNDQLPSGSSTSFGHTKGMMGWSADGNAGWLLTHSVPKYGESPEQGATGYSYPSNGQENGQSMMCITMGIPSLEQMFQQLQYTNPQLFGKQWVASLTSRLPNGNAFVNQNIVVKTAASRIANVTSVGGRTFTHFAKTAAWGKSIFGNLIGAYYNQPILVETWQRPYELPVHPPTVAQSEFSVLALAAPSYAGWDGGAVWKVTQDHAKWGISQRLSSNPSPLLCVGDINKQQTQYVRSGGMMCIVDRVLQAAYASLVTKTDEDVHAGQMQQVLGFIGPEGAEKEQEQRQGNNTRMAFE